MFSLSMVDLILDINEPVTEANLDSLVEAEIEAQVEAIDEEEYDQMLDDCYPPCEIGNMTFEPSDVLKECDPTAYRCGMVDYADSRREDFEDDVRDLIESMIESDEED